MRLGSIPAPSALALAALLSLAGPGPAAAVQQRDASPGPVGHSRAELCRRVSPELERMLGGRELTTHPRLGELRQILSRLQRASAHPGLRLRLRVFDGDPVNAFATPCDEILVTRGMLEWQAAVAAERAREEGASARELADSFAASILAHELAHLALGHTGELVDEPVRELRLMTGEGGEGEGADPALAGDAVRAARFSQERELAADRTGALYLLRAGWEIQDAMDLFRALDGMMRRSPGETCFYCPESTSYLSSHPRPSTREAALESFRAELKLHQTRFDDALSLILHEVELEAAIDMLDEVLRDFPDLIAARHARAAAWHALWLRSVPVQAQRVRASLPTYSARFLPRIRGEAGDRRLLTEARMGYEQVLAAEELPYTLSNLAVLEAYAGAVGAARFRARRAAELAPGDVQVLNNLGVVHYLAGDPAAAREAFGRALEAPGGDAWPPLRFNLGRTLHDLGDPQAAEWLLSYLGADGRSGWARLARTMVRARGEAPAGADVRPPELAGVRLAAPPDSVRAALAGPPDRERDVGLQLLWHYEGKGLLVTIDRRQGVSFVDLRKPGVSRVYGVDVGEPVERLSEAVAEAWGVDGAGEVGARDFAATDQEELWYFFPSVESDWLLSVVAREGRIASIAVGRVE